MSSSITNTWRLSVDQQQQVLALNEVAEARLKSAIHWSNAGTLANLCRFVWTDEATFKAVCEALKKEALRAWLIQASRLYYSDEWLALKKSVWGPDLSDYDLVSINRTYQEMEALRHVVVQKMEHVPKLAPKPVAKEDAPRVPIPEETRQTLLRLNKEPCIIAECLNLASSIPNLIPGSIDWQISFASDAELCAFQVRVDEVERTYLERRIEDAVSKYPNGSPWSRFMECARAHFGSRVNMVKWWSQPNTTLPELRLLLDMLLQGQYLDKFQIAPVPKKTSPKPGVVLVDRVPLPESTRATILCIKQQLVEKQAYHDLCITYTNAFRNPVISAPVVFDSSWSSMDFATESDLQAFQNHVDRAERLLLKQKILKAIDDYPNTKWPDFKRLIIAHFGNRAETYRWWAKEDVALEDLRFYLDLLGQYDLDKVKVMIAHRCLETTPSKEKEAVSPAAPAVVRIPIPEATRKTLLQFVNDPAVASEYIALLNYYIQHLRPPERPAWFDWHVQFIDETDLADFQAKVDQVERYWLIGRIRTAIYMYPGSRWNQLQSMAVKHFGMMANFTEWFSMSGNGCSLEQLRFYLKMLGEEDLNKVKAMIEPEAADPKSKVPEPKVPAPTPTSTSTPAPAPAPKPLTLAQRKIRFLNQLRDKDHLWGALASYMDQTDSQCNLEGIARAVSLTDNAALLDEWEDIVNKTDPEHIFWKVMDRQIDEVERHILKGLGDLSKNQDSRSVQQRILFWWNTYKQPKRELICAYLDTLPNKAKVEEQKKQ